MEKQLYENKKRERVREREREGELKTRFETISRFRSQIFGPGTSRSDSLADWKTVKHLTCLSNNKKHSDPIHCFTML